MADLLSSDPNADLHETDAQKRTRRLKMLNDPKKYLFNGSVSLSAIDGAGLGLIAKRGGIPPLRVLEFKGGRLGWTWSDLAFHNTGFVIHLVNGRAYIATDLMDYKQTGRHSTHAPSADFINTTLRHGQTISQHRNYRLPRNYALDELNMMFSTQNCIIASLIDDHGALRVFAESAQFIECDMECLAEYDLDSYCLEFGYARFDPNAPRVGFATWSNGQKVEWAMAKLKWDPVNHYNLAVAIIDMVRHDIDQLEDFHIHTTWYHDLIFAAKQHFLQDYRQLVEARARRDVMITAATALLTDGETVPKVNRELFYQIDFIAADPIWFVLSQLEYEITHWIHRNWLELHMLGARDEDGLLPERPSEWMIATAPWTYGWWRYLRRLDNMNIQRNRPYYINVLLGDVREFSEWNMPYGTSYHGPRSTCPY